MSKVWSSMIIISIIFAIISGNSGIVIDSVMESGKTSVENIITLAGMMCFWSGIFNIFEKTNAINVFSKKFSKFLLKLFKKNEVSESALKYMSMNIVSNVLGVGNAATINGINAIKELQETNPYEDKPSDSMTTFVLLNTASLQLIPTSMIALRTMYNSASPTAIVVPIWIVTSLSLIAGIISIKILNKKVR